MPFVHLSAGGIPAPPDEVWELLGPGFQSAAAAWRPAVCAGCRPARADEIPAKLRRAAGPCPPPCRGRVIVPNPFLGHGEVVQTLTEYDPDRRQLTWACGFPLPVIQNFFCTVYVVDDGGDDAGGDAAADGAPADGARPSSASSRVHMECEWYPVPGFCWVGELLGFRDGLATEMRGPAGDLRDLKGHFERKRRRERGGGATDGGPDGAPPPFRATNEKGRPHRLRRGHHLAHRFCEAPRWVPQCAPRLAPTDASPPGTPLAEGAASRPGPSAADSVGGERVQRSSMAGTESPAGGYWLVDSVLQVEGGGGAPTKGTSNRWRDQTTEMMETGAFGSEQRGGAKVEGKDKR